MIDTIYIDMDGVIVNSEPLHHLAYKKMFKESPCSYGACIPVALNILKKKNGIQVKLSYLVLIGKNSNFFIL